jgi:hypothetical protein
LPHPRLACDQSLVSPTGEDSSAATTLPILDGCTRRGGLGTTQLTFAHQLGSVPIPLLSLRVGRLLFRRPLEATTPLLRPPALGGWWGEWAARRRRRRRRRARHPLTAIAPSGSSPWAACPLPRSPTVAMSTHHSTSLRHMATPSSHSTRSLLMLLAQPSYTSSRRDSRADPRVTRGSPLGASFTRSFRPGHAFAQQPRNGSNGVTTRRRQSAPRGCGSRKTLHIYAPPGSIGSHLGLQPGFPPHAERASAGGFTGLYDASRVCGGVGRERPRVRRQRT